MSVQNFLNSDARFNYVDKNLIAADLLAPTNVTMQITEAKNPGLVIEFTKNNSKKCYTCHLRDFSPNSTASYEVLITPDQETRTVEDRNDHGNMRKLFDRRVNNESYKNITASLAKLCWVVSVVSGIALAVLFARHTPLDNLPVKVLMVSMAGALASEFLTTYFRMTEHDATTRIIQTYFKVLNYALKSEPVKNANRQLPQNYPDLIQVS